VGRERPIEGTLLLFYSHYLRARFSSKNRVDAASSDAFMRFVVAAGLHAGAVAQAFARSGVATLATRLNVNEIFVSLI
jgi:hypothetical protein